MVIETMKCQECGSPDVIELKPGTYVCRNCEAVFRQAQGGAVVVGCEIAECGVLAVGRCRDCGNAFCASHGVASAASCEVCIRVRTDRANEASELQAAQILAQRQAAAERSQTELQERIARLKAIPDRMERLVRALCGPADGMEHLDFGQMQSYVMTGDRKNINMKYSPPVLQAVFPELWPGTVGMDLLESPPWDHDEVQNWFFGRVHGNAARDKVRIQKRTLLGGSKEVLVPAWWFKEGSTCEQHQRIRGIGITQDGERLFEGGEPFRRDEGFNGRALQEMGAILGLA